MSSTHRGGLKLFKNWIPIMGHPSEGHFFWPQAEWANRALIWLVWELERPFF